MKKLEAIQEIKSQKQRLKILKEILPAKAYDNLANSANEIIEETKRILCINEYELEATI